uniref:hypothetical protein n=1 Tax=uncultured Allobacillus sp. TaxID=1638025 RepID=UPI002597C102|nr:hypothetical protein [uncultured Allobacillus sp.]
MKKALKTFSVVLGIVLVGIVSLVIIFIVEMTPSTSKENETRELAEKYLEENYPDEDVEVADILYDNMGNYGDFDYAAVVRYNDLSGASFLVYYDEDFDKVVEKKSHELK